MQGIPMRASLTTAFALLVAFAAVVTPAAAGTLKVTSFPSGAEVIVDGVNTGKLTPMNISLATSAPSRFRARAGIPTRGR